VIVIETCRAKIHYVFHSGFTVKTTNYLLIFDYYGGTGNNELRQENFRLISREIKDANNIVVFVSHSHSDHFDSDIFKFEQLTTNILYIFSSDIKIKNKKHNYYFVGNNEELMLENIHIKTFGSTDEGVSYLVNADNLNIFHAGDLNWWYWYYESTPEELDEYERDYKSVIQDIVEETCDKNIKIDIAFFPVDSRLKDYYHFGGEYFIRNLKPKYFIPMHFGYDYSITEDFSLKFKDVFTDTEILTINSRGQNFIIK